MRILFIAARFPHPPVTGDRARAFHQLRLLGLRHRVTLVCLDDGRATDDGPVGRFCAEVIRVPQPRLEIGSGVVRSLFSRYPLQSGVFASEPLRRVVREQAVGAKHDVAHIQLARLTPHVAPDVRIPRVVDLIDALSLNMRRRYQADAGPARWLAYLDWRRLRRYEREICQTHDEATVVSAVERGAIGAFSNLAVNPNGVDLERFPFHDGPRDSHRVVFTGNLGYFPNEHAVRWFVREILPRVRRERPEVEFEAVGARPTPRLLALARHDPAIAISGPVDDLHPHLARASVAVAPMRAGSGQLLKVLEAMAAGTPVATTSLGLAGIDARHDAEALVADDAERFAAAVVRLLSDRDAAQRLARQARHLVETRYTWDQSVNALERIYETVVATAREPAVGDPIVQGDGRAVPTPSS